MFIEESLSFENFSSSGLRGSTNYYDVQYDDRVLPQGELEENIPEFPFSEETQRRLSTDTFAITNDLHDHAVLHNDHTALLDTILQDTLLQDHKRMDNAVIEKNMMDKEKPLKNGFELASRQLTNRQHVSNRQNANNKQQLNNRQTAGNRQQSNNKNQYSVKQHSTKKSELNNRQLNGTQVTNAHPNNGQLSNRQQLTKRRQLHNGHHLRPRTEDQLRIGKDYFDDLSDYLNLEDEVPEVKKNPVLEQNLKCKIDEDALIDIFKKNGAKCESKSEMAKILAKAKKKYVWAPGFCLQLGSKGRKIMLQLLRMAYKTNKKNKRVFQCKNPPTTISNLPFFKINMLWELAYDMGVFDEALLIHEFFGNVKRTNKPSPSLYGEFQVTFNNKKPDPMKYPLPNPQINNIPRNGYVYDGFGGFNDSYNDPYVQDHIPISFAHSAEFVGGDNGMVPDSNDLSNIISREEFISTISETYTRSLAMNANNQFLHDDNTTQFVQRIDPLNVHFRLGDPQLNSVHEFVTNNAMEDHPVRVEKRRYRNGLKHDTHISTSPSSLSTDVPSVTEDQINDDEIYLHHSFE
ncbi:hypothetical protein TpMuguga_01g00230 [Theileria parva strain Muguga]|uniref:Uncharacterized protein n=1 Tax=Theileria parva TaxID=5875 RepID=Q4N984_THEPA|nr:uncharacterized protein TpMuguga_01g00230 [Theileria parva strain Muguga]EAN33474.1 hypothetical protein TpMuguga_01g00230 [Theileria parva strain Muguga]|eukprot:XP_765757.1 hypothetical protein [Theileria parva strain Muguga]